MRTRYSIGSVGLAAVLLLAPNGWCAFMTLKKVSVKAVAQVTGLATLFVAADPLPAQAFYGKNVVIPMTVSSNATIDTRNLKVEMDYQILDAQGTPTAGIAIAPVTLVIDSKNPNMLKGAAILSRDNLTPIRHGGTLQYFFRARQISGDTILQKTGIIHAAPAAGIAAANAPFQVAIIDTLSAPVLPAGGQVTVPDTYVSDGQTTVSFDPGSISAPGTLIIKEDDADTFPAGPKGMKPAIVYSITLEGARLLREARITLSYPAEVDGTVTGTGSDAKPGDRSKPTDLAPYYLNGLTWALLSRPQLDTTLHTVTAVTTHFSTFALFASGPVSAKDERPPQRIITPNGDGHNDTANFANAADEDIHLFDIRGRRIRTLHGPQSVWDGKDDDGRVVESGVYVYQYKSQGDRISGVIYVAK